jgi:hypothetical protein
MKQILFILLFACVSTFATANELQLHVNPAYPYLIPQGTANNGPQAPYFSMNGVTVKWSGEKSVEIQSVFIISKDHKYTCSLAGVSMSPLFAGTIITDCKGRSYGQALTANGTVFIANACEANCPLSVKSNPFYCDRVKVHVSANPFAFYNIPMTVGIVGRTLSGDLKSERVTASQEIVIQ